MCYKTTQEENARQLEKIMEKKRREGSFANELPFKFDLNAFANPEIFIIAQDSSEYISTATWGLVPFWGKKDPEAFLKNKKYTLNARGEDFWETKSYKPYVQEGRCVMLFDGFYEPHTYKGDKKQPYYCYIPKNGDYKSRHQLQIAGIYSVVNDNYYVSLVTTEANDFFATVHNAKKRMPLVLDAKFVKDWLEPNQSKSVIDGLVREGFTSKQFHAHAVTNDIYKRDFIRDDKSIIEPVEPIEDLSLS